MKNILKDDIQFKRVKDNHFILETNIDIYEKIKDKYLNFFTETESRYFNAINNDNLVVEILYRVISDTFYLKHKDILEKEEHLYIDFSIKGENKKLALSSILGDIKGIVYGVIE